MKNITRIKRQWNIPVQAKASFWFLVCAFLQKGISMLTTPVFTRLLTTAEYGQYSVFCSWMGVLTIFVTFNLSMGVYSQGLVKYEEDQKAYSSSLQGLTIVLVLVWMGIYLMARDFWNRAFSLTTVQMLAMLVMIWTSAVFQFWASEQRVRFKYRALVAITLAVSLAKPLVGIFFVTRAEDKVKARILGLVLVEAVSYTGLFIVQMVRGKKFYSKKFWKSALAFNIPLIPHYLSQTILSNADRIMIRDMVDESSAGIYSLAYSLALIMMLFNTALMQTVSPWIYGKIRDGKTDEISRVAYGTMVLVAGVNLMLIMIAPEAVAFFAPESYYDAVWIIPPVAMSVYFMFCYDLFAKFAFYFEQTKVIMLASIAGAVLNVVLNYIFIQIFGYIAAGYTTLLCYIVYAAGHYCFMTVVCKKFCDGKLPYDKKKIVGISVVFLTGGFGLLFTYFNTNVRYGVIILTIVFLIWKRKILIYEIAKMVKGKFGE